MDHNKKIIESINNSQTPLPDDFWAKIEPNIPTYGEEKKRPFFFPMSCMSISMIGLIGSAIALIYFYQAQPSVNHKDNNSQIERVNNFVAHSAQKHSTNNTHINGPSINASSNALRSQEDRPSVISKHTLAHSTNTSSNKPITLSESRIASIDAPTTYATNQSLNPSTTRPSEATTPHPFSTTTTTTTESIENISVPSLINISASPHRPFSLLESSSPNEVIALPMVVPIQPHIEKLHSITLSYHIGRLARYMQPSNEEFDQKMRYRNQSERTFYTHEASLAWQYKLSSRIESHIGVRYSDVQTLFDFTEEISSTDDLIFRQGKHIIESTQHIKMIDVVLGMEYHMPIATHIVCSPYMTIAQNIHTNVTGRYLDGDNAVSNLQDDAIYKPKMGVNFETGIKMQYRWSSQCTSVLGLGYRQYVSSFSQKEYGIDIKYKGAIANIGMNYAF